MKLGHFRRKFSASPPKTSERHGVQLVRLELPRAALAYGVVAEEDTASSSKRAVAALSNVVVQLVVVVGCGKLLKELR